MAFPTVVQTSTGRTTNTNTTNHPITMPSGITPGNLLVVFFSCDGNALLTYTSGWVRIEQETYTNTVKGVIYFKYATGSDEMTITSDTGEASSHVVYELANAAPPIVESVSGSSTNANPPGLNTGYTRDYLFIAAAMMDSTVVATSAPSSFTNLTVQAAAGTNGASVSTARRSLTAQTLDPGTFTSNSEQWAAFTVAFGEWGSYDVQVGTDPTVVNNSSAGSLAWSNPSYAAARDEVYSTVTPNTSNFSNYLWATGYGFSVPINATILGVVTSIKKYRTGGSTGAVRDRVVSLIKGNSITGSNYADTGTNWAAQDDTFTYGGAGDMWGTSLTPADVNASDFGFAFSTTGSGSTSNRIANVDNMRMIVYYQPVLNEPPTVVMNTADGVSMSTPGALLFTGTDPEGNELTYEIMVDSAITFDSQ